ncbi:MAG: transposase [Patescibacteria group bacterium]
MPGRVTPIVTGEFYHIFNRGAEKRITFLTAADYKRFIKTFYYYQFLGPKQKYSNFTKLDLSSHKLLSTEKIVDVACYCLMPNHFHFLVKQLRDGGIAQFASQISNSYTKYFNTKYDRVGSLFQGTYKAVYIENDEQMMHISRYIHINPFVSPLGVVSFVGSYPWSSYGECLLGKTVWCNPHYFLDLFSSIQVYKDFVEKHVEYSATVDVLKYKIIEDI